MNTCSNAGIKERMTIVRQTIQIGMIVLTLGLAQLAEAQKPPSWGSESSPTPNAGGSVSRDVNAAADRGMNHDIEYSNASKMGPKLVVLPGEVKSNNSSFLQKFGPNNIADFADIFALHGNHRDELVDLLHYANDR